MSCEVLDFDLFEHIGPVSNDATADRVALDIVTVPNLTLQY